MASCRAAAMATVALSVLFILASCDPPPPPITLDTQEYRSTCTDVGRGNLGPGLDDVLGPDELAAARRIVGVDPSEAFAVRHDDSRHQCAGEDDGDWFLVSRVDLSQARVDELKEQVRAPAS